MSEVGERQASAEIEVTPEMVRAGVDAYLARASHDELSFSTPEEVVDGVLRAALSVPTKQGEMSEAHKRQVSADEIEVTPEMVDAGLDALIAYRNDDNDAFMVTRVFLEMLDRFRAGGLATPPKQHRPKAAASGVGSPDRERAGFLPFVVEPEQVRKRASLSWPQGAAEGDLSGYCC